MCATIPLPQFASYWLTWWVSQAGRCFKKLKAKKIVEQYCGCVDFCELSPASDHTTACKQGIKKTNHSRCSGKCVTLRIINKIRCMEQVHNAKKSTVLCQFTPVTSRAHVFLLVLFEHTFKVQGS